MGVAESVRGVEVDVVERDEDALEGDGETGGDVPPRPRAVRGEISRRKRDGGVRRARGEREPRRTEMLDAHERQSWNLAVIKPK